MKNEYSKYLKSFIIASSFPIFFTFFLKVASIDDSIKNYSYETYTIIAPLYFGIMNVLATILQNKTNLSKKDIYFYFGIVSPLIVITFAKLSKSYNFTKEEWMKYSVRLFIKHFLIYRICIYFLENII